MAPRTIFGAIGVALIFLGTWMRDTYGIVSKLKFWR